MDLQADQHPLVQEICDFALGTEFHVLARTCYELTVVTIPKAVAFLQRLAKTALLFDEVTGAGLTIHQTHP